MQQAQQARTATTANQWTAAQLHAGSRSRHSHDASAPTARVSALEDVLLQTSAAINPVVRSSASGFGSTAASVIVQTLTITADVASALQQRPVRRSGSSSGGTSRGTGPQQVLPCGTGRAWQGARQELQAAVDAATERYWHGVLHDAKHGGSVAHSTEVRLLQQPNRAASAAGMHL